MALSKRHQQFVNEYLKTWNQTEAYRRVYPSSSDDAARANAARLIADDNVAKAISERIAESAMSADEVLVRLAEQARAAYSPYITESGEVDIELLVSEGKAHLIKGVKETQYGKSIEFYDAQSALVHVGRHHKLFTDRQEGTQEATVTVTLQDWRQQTAASRKQADSVMDDFANSVSDDSQ